MGRGRFTAISARVNFEGTVIRLAAARRARFVAGIIWDLSFGISSVQLAGIRKFHWLPPFPPPPLPPTVFSWSIKSRMYFATAAERNWPRAGPRHYAASPWELLPASRKISPKTFLSCLLTAKLAGDTAPVYAPPWLTVLPSFSQSPVSFIFLVSSFSGVAAGEEFRKTRVTTIIRIKDRMWKSRVSRRKTGLSRYFKLYELKWKLISSINTLLSMLYFVIQWYDNWEFQFRTFRTSTRVSCSVFSVLDISFTDILHIKNYFNNKCLSLRPIHWRGKQIRSTLPRFIRTHLKKWSWSINF